VRAAFAGSVTGIQPADEIISVNHRDASEYPLSRLREMFKHEGREYQLQVKRCDKTMNVKLKTRRLI
jgi:C-terminal processing protease CtpA/Prc